MLMSAPYVNPSYKVTIFNCPHCNAYTPQNWYKIRHYEQNEVNILPSYENPEDSNRPRLGERKSVPRDGMMPYPEQTVDYASLSTCSYCKQCAFWVKNKMVYPVVSLAPLPSDDMPEDVKADYMEAASIVEASPRASSALLRLALQKLMPHLGEKGTKIDDDIGSLVKKGLPTEIQQALDVVRVIGNESVHPGELDLKDDTKTAYFLFELVNIIIEDRITKLKKINTIYNKLPQSKLDGINNRVKK